MPPRPAVVPLLRIVSNDRTLRLFVVAMRRLGEKTSKSDASVANCEVDDSMGLMTPSARHEARVTHAKPATVVDSSDLIKGSTFEETEDRKLIKLHA